MHLTDFLHCENDGPVLLVPSMVHHQKNKTEENPQPLKELHLIVHDHESFRNNLCAHLPTILQCPILPNYTYIFIKGGNDNIYIIGLLQRLNI